METRFRKQLERVTPVTNCIVNQIIYRILIKVHIQHGWIFGFVYKVRRALYLISDMKTGHIVGRSM